MSQTLIIELSDEVYTMIQRQAEEAGTSPADWVANALERQSRVAALNSIMDLVANPDFEAVWVDETLHREALALLIARQDKTYSLCDAVSFVLMRQRHLKEMLTTDRHFEQEGFQRLLV